MLSIGLDIGTTGICGVLIDSDSGSVIKTESRANNFFINTGKEYERIQDAQKIYNAVEEILGALFTKDAECIGVTGQMHGIVYLDADGNLVSPLYTWQDMRASLPYKEGTYSSVFGAPAGYGLATNFYNRINGLIPQNACIICTVHDYVAMRLCGNKKPLLHSSDAASLGGYDCEKRCFSADEPLLPDSVDTSRVIGEYKGVPVCIAIGDNQASYIGSAKDGSALINIGTGSQVTVPAASYRNIRSLETRPLGGDEYILVGCAICGGRAFAMLENFFGSVCEMAGMKRENLYPFMDEMLKEDYETDLSFDTRFCGSRTYPDVKASVTNLTENNFTAKDMAFALLDGIAQELYDFYAVTGNKAKYITGSGNGIRKNAALCRTLEKKFGCKLIIPAHREEAAYGAALIALKAAGKFDSIKQAQSLIHYL
ncbi:MAG: hypothetical protein MJ177_03090 [Clostridia bacterium]|nr:hypothetical protein [Clostridia bacterium]